MRAWRWDLVVAAALLAVAIIVHGLLGRYAVVVGRDGDPVIVDRATGTPCYASPSARGSLCLPDSRSIRMPDAGKAVPSTR